MKPAEVYILNQPEIFRDILLNLQVGIENAIPELELFFKWKIPYYYYNGKPFCFLNANQKGKFVDVAFNKGFQLQNNLQVLIGDKRNTFKSLRYFSLVEVNIDILNSVIEEAKRMY